MQYIDDEIASRLILDDGRVLSKCDVCREQWRERNDRGIAGDPPCDTCKVELREENETAANVYMIVRRQYVTAEQGRVVDVSIPAIKAVMDLFQVKDQLKCLVRVQRLFHLIENERRSSVQN